MLRTRLIVGSVLIGLTVGMLLVDEHLAPLYPFLFVFVFGLSLAATHEFIRLLGPNRRPQMLVSYVGVAAFALTNWVIHFPAWHPSPWPWVLAVLAGLVLTVFLYEMAFFDGSGRSVERMALTLFIVAYLGFLPCFFAQLRWLYPASQASYTTIALALAIFVPKSCDVGAYFTGRLIGRHPMAPVLSPKKTLEGMAGGLVTAALTAILIDRLGPAPLLRHNLLIEIGFGLTIGLAGMLGDLAESLIKRDCHRKDASHAVPGFGGVLDVVDAVVFAAPVAYGWFTLTPVTHSL
jgi:phosphatidate cytidylyltransferase